VLLARLWFSASAVVPQLRASGRVAAGGVADGERAARLRRQALISALANLADRVAPPQLIVACGAAGRWPAAIALGNVGAGTAIALPFVTGAMLAGVYPPGMKLVASWSVGTRPLDRRHGRGPDPRLSAAAPAQRARRHAALAAGGLAASVFA
jgi:hypothetical protein